MGILICGLNGAGKSTVGREFAKRISYQFIDIENLYFPKGDSSYIYSDPKSKEQVIRSLEKAISLQEDKYVLAAVKGDYGKVFKSSLSLVVLIEVPKSIRLKRVYDRSFFKFGERILDGGDLFERENNFFTVVRNRPENYVTSWIESVDCPVVKIDGTRTIEENVDFLLSIT